ncbi:MAG TPA: hypothetical protein VG779_10655 [Actinomycetota bacterium]|jgi:hypothetical protein|nr:hypothetical protein [Actinomycetota bacterium]
MRDDIGFGPEPALRQPSNNATPAILLARGLAKRFGDVTAVDDVSREL